jgi:hypothetical protein
LQLARQLAAARSLGNAAGDTKTITQPVFGPDGKQLFNPDGSPQLQTVIVNQARLAESAGGDGIAGNPLLGPIPGAGAAPGANAPVSPVGGIATGVPVLTPQQQSAQAAHTAQVEEIGKQYGKEAADVVQGGYGAPDILGKADILDAAKKTFTTGAGAKTGLALGQAVVGALNAAGITPPDGLAQSVASGETIGKVGTGLAAAMTKSLGSREAASVFEALANANPNISLSDKGYDAIVQSVRQGAQRQSDLFKYQEAWLRPIPEGGLGHNTVVGMLQSFNQNHPIEQYASKVAPFPFPPSQDKGQAGVIYQTAKGPAIWDGKRFNLVQQ